MRLILVLLIVAGFTGCIDVRNFAGTWSGDVVSEPALRQGFTDAVRVDPLELSNVDLEGISAVLTTSDKKFEGAVLNRVPKFSNDTLASLTFDGDPLRSYLLFASLASESERRAAMMLVSLFSDEHVELRILRDNDLFGVFHLRRREE